MHHLTLTDDEVANLDELKNDPEFAWLHAKIAAAHFDDRGALLITVGEDAAFESPLRNFGAAIDGVGSVVDLHYADDDGHIVKARILDWTRTDGPGWEALRVDLLDDDYRDTGRVDVIDIAEIARIDYR